MSILNLVKESLGIVSTSTARDAELQNLIDSALADMERLGIDTTNQSALISTACVTYVKAHFGASNPDNQAKFESSYEMIVDNLRNSSGFREG